MTKKEKRFIELSNNFFNKNNYTSELYTTILEFSEHKIRFNISYFNLMSKEKYVVVNEYIFTMNGVHRLLNRFPTDKDLTELLAEVITEEIITAPKDHMKGKEI